jgi:hypothetical protein
MRIVTEIIAWKFTQPQAALDASLMADFVKDNWVIYKPVYSSKLVTLLVNGH